MEALEIRTAEGVTLSVEVAGAGTRLAAGAIDMLILVSSSVFAVLLLQGLAGYDPSGTLAFVSGFVALGILLFWVLYHVLFHLAEGAATPGKRLLGIHVVSLDGGPAGSLALVLRGLLWILDALLLVPIPLGLIVIAVTPRRQRIGDLVAGTLVVHTPARRAEREPWPRETWSALDERVLPLTLASAARFDAADLDFLRRLVLRRGIEARERQELYVRAAHHFAARLGSDAPARDARAALKELYLFLREQRATVGS